MHYKSKCWKTHNVVSKYALALVFMRYIQHNIEESDNEQSHLVKESKGIGKGVKPVKKYVF